LRLKGIDPERAYSREESRSKVDRRAEDAPAVKIHKRGTVPDPLRVRQ